MKFLIPSRDSRLTVPFLNEEARIGTVTSSSPWNKGALTYLIEPFISEPPEHLQPPQPSQPSKASQTSQATTPVVMTVTPLRPQPSREQVVTVAPSSRRDEKRLLPTGPIYTMESISRLNLGLEVNSRDHSVVGQPSDYESGASVVPPHHQGRENDGGVSLLGSSEAINPKALRLPPDYRRFLP